MFTLCKICIKTTFILFLFTAGASCLFAGNLIQENITGSSLTVPVFIFQDDTIKSKTLPEKKENESVIPDHLSNVAINFQVNSDIVYLRFDHFVKDESKKMFYQAWLKEKELARISNQTDSLRKVYGNSADSQKDEISLSILKNEERSVSLNQEIPVLYQNARDEENRYWQSATADEIARFHEIIRLLKESDQHLSNKQTAPIIPDTIIFHDPSQKTVIKTEVPSGIVFKIQVGAYKGKVPDSAVKSIKKLSVIRKVENFKEEKGVTIYSTGNLKSYEEAVTMQSQVKQEGIKNATIVAYQNGKRITIEEARGLKK